MGVILESGYTVPGGDEPLTHARILHANNRLAIKSITGGDETADGPASALQTALTYEYWIPFSNQISAPSDLSDTGNWTATRLTVGSDGQTLDEGTDAATSRFIEQPFTWTAAEWVLSVKAERQTMDGIGVRANDGTDDFNVYFDLRDGSVDTEGVNVTGSSITDLGDGIYECLMYFTPAAASGDVTIFGWNAAGDLTYTGTNRTVKIRRVTAHESLTTLRLDTFAAQEADAFCLAAHNLGSSGARLIFQHDSNEDDTWTTVGSDTQVSDNSPIMCIFAPVTSARWRISVQRCALPKIAVLHVGKALQMQQPLYGGHSPLDMARQTVMRSNYSETGEFLGKSKQRTYFQTEFAWSHLTASWVRTNWRPFQKAVETEPFFIAWRPDAFSEVGYCQTDSVPIPSNMGVRDYMSVSLSVRGLGYD